MDFEFSTHYTIDEARALLPRVRRWLAGLRRLRDEATNLEAPVATALESADAVGGKIVNRWITKLAEMKIALEEFESREIQIKDLDRGLVDFPSIIEGREVFLCWEEGEEDIEFWHDLNSGYAGREPLP